MDKIEKLFDNSILSQNTQLSQTSQITNYAHTNNNVYDSSNQSNFDVYKLLKDKKSAIIQSELYK